MKSETAYQAKLIKKIKALMPGCFILKNDPKDIQGLPDLLVLFQDKWAMLEVKLSKKADVQPNQDHYVKEFGEMSFAAFIYPENEEEVLSALQSTFGAVRQTRVS